MIAISQHFIHDLKKIDDEIIFFLIGAGQCLFSLPSLTELLAQVEISFFKLNGAFLNPDFQLIP